MSSHPLPEPLPLDPAAIAALSGISTATITTVLLKKGLRNVWMRGTRPLVHGQPRIVGPAFTLRFVPAREDLATPASWANPSSTRAAIRSGLPRGAIIAGNPAHGRGAICRAPGARAKGQVI